MDDLALSLGKEHELSLILGYGDSTDYTDALLHENIMCRLYDSLLVSVAHGGHHYGSIVHPERFRQLAHVCNTLWQNIPQDAEVVGLVESDLLWQYDMLYNLISLVAQHKNLIMAPMVMHTDGRFYDTWAFRIEGQSFVNYKPYHPSVIDPKVSSRRFYKMDSVGSVLFMQGDLARKLHFPEKDVVVGLCNLAREDGATILLDSFSEVYHP
jgi:hypothetical protein